MFLKIYLINILNKRFEVVCVIYFLDLLLKVFFIDKYV